MNPEPGKKQDYSYVQPAQQPPQYAGASFTPQPYMPGAQPQPFVVHNTIVISGDASQLSSSRGNMTVVGFLLVIFSVLCFCSNTSSFFVGPTASVATGQAYVISGSVFGYLMVFMIMASGIFAIKSGKPDGTHRQAKIAFGLLLTVAIVWVIEFAAVAGFLGFASAVFCSALSFMTDNVNQYNPHGNGNVAADAAGACAGILGIVWASLVGTFCCVLCCCCVPCLYIQKKHVNVTAVQMV